MKDSFGQFEDVENFLYALRNAGSKYSLDRISKLCALIGNPQRDYPVIHVAGTNGKGSVCAMLERVLRASGLKTGMYTSPHLVYLGERVQVGRIPISRSELCGYVRELRKTADSVFDPSDEPSYPSFFEYMTALAFGYFSQKKIDCGVIEVGLGGRLDSTNIVFPELSVITSIGLDHIQMLGSTLGQIAREKAGIIKPNTPVVCGFLPPDAMRVVEAVAREKSAPIYRAEDFFTREDDMPYTCLYGEYQRRNAAVTLLCVRVLRDAAIAGKAAKFFADISDAAALEALKEVDWAARWQKIDLQNGARLILDASHNEEGARTLESNLRSYDFGGKKPIITVGVLGEERAVPLLEVVKKYARKIVLLVPDQPRALGFAALRRCLGEYGVEVADGRVSEIYKDGNCSLAERGDTVVSTGSIYLAGEVMAALSGNDADNLQDRPYK